MKAGKRSFFGGASRTRRGDCEAWSKQVTRWWLADPERERIELMISEIGGTFVTADVTDESRCAKRSRKPRAPGPAGASSALGSAVNCAGVGASQTDRPEGRARPASTVGKWASASHLIGTINVLSQAAAAMVGNEPDGDGQPWRLHQHCIDLAADDGRDRPDRLRPPHGRVDRPDPAGCP